MSASAAAGSGPWGGENARNTGRIGASGEKIGRPTMTPTSSFHNGTFALSSAELP